MHRRRIDDVLGGHAEADAARVCAVNLQPNARRNLAHLRAPNAAGRAHIRAGERWDARDEPRRRHVARGDACPGERPAQESALCTDFASYHSCIRYLPHRRSSQQSVFIQKKRVSTFIDGTRLVSDLSRATRRSSRTVRPDARADCRKIARRHNATRSGHSGHSAVRPVSQLVSNPQTAPSSRRSSAADGGQ